MPNWCDCDLIVTATKKFQAELKEFKEFAKSDVSDFDEASGKKEVLDADKFIPSPFTQLEKEKQRIAKLPTNERKDAEILLNLKYANENKEDDGWYNWNCANWGSKWNCAYTELEKETDSKLKYRFSSAWSPMLPLILAMAKKYPNLKFDFRYYEGGMGFSGSVVIHNNKVIKDSHNNGYRGGRGG